MNKNIIPIVFAFDKNFEEPALVTIFSLLDNAKKDTFYDIWIFSNDLDDNGSFLKLQEMYDNNCKMNFYDPENAFKDAHNERHLTTPTYYRLLMPEVLKVYDKAIWCDVDIIINNDLSEVFNIDISDYYVSGVCEYFTHKVLWDWDIPYIENINLDPKKYINAGFTIWNLDAFRKNNLAEKMIDLVYNNKFRFLEQDALNIICEDRIFFLNKRYNFMGYFIEAYTKFKNYRESFPNEEDLITHNEEIKDILKNINDIVIFHYPGDKPWSYFFKTLPERYNLIFFEEIWWEYYKKSPFFSNEKYFNYILKKLEIKSHFGGKIGYFLSQNTENLENTPIKHLENITIKYQKLWQNDWAKFGRRSFIGKIKFLLIYPFKKILKSNCGVNKNE